MHIPKLYREEDPQVIYNFMKDHGFPALVSNDGGTLLATHLPVEVRMKDNGRFMVYGHMSRANPQWRSIGDQEVLMIFQGAHTYISPRWYDHVNVPTWNYMIVHAYGKIRMLEGEELLGLLKSLVAKYEEEHEYSLERLPADFVEKEMKGVAGFILDVTRVDAAYKLSQNRNDRDHANIIAELEKRGHDDSSAIAQAMRTKRPPA